MSNPPTLDFDELVAATNGIHKRVHALLRASESRNVAPRFRSCLKDVMTLLDGAVSVLHDPECVIPRLENRSRTTERAIAPGTWEPRRVAREMTDTAYGKLVMKAAEGFMNETDRPKSLTGHTSCVALPELLEFLGTLGKSGSLCVKSKQETITVMLDRGHVVQAMSTNSPPELKLGAILVTRGFVTPEALETFLARHARNGGRIGAAMEREELVSRQQLVEALEYQVQCLFNRLFQARNAQFTFQEREPNGFDQRVRLSILGLLLESARVSDEMHPSA